MENKINYLVVKKNEDCSKLNIIFKSPNKEKCIKFKDDRLERTPDHVRNDSAYVVVNEAGYKRLLNKRDKVMKEKRARAAVKAAATRKKNGTKKRFILCPTCDSKSKKLFSEMGGLQTRMCKRGHKFEVDTFFGFETDKRRVENTDRPFMVNGNYNDYVYGKFKNNPNGK